MAACLNPAVYRPDLLDKMLRAAGRCVVYFSMDTPLEGSENEPVYRGCNSVRYAEAYLEELGVPWRKIPERHSYKTENGTVREIPFAYLIISAENVLPE